MGATLGQRHDVIHSEILRAMGRHLPPRTPVTMPASMLCHHTACYCSVPTGVATLVSTATYCIALGHVLSLMCVTA
jgi:hypothetical protein